MSRHKVQADLVVLLPDDLESRVKDVRTKICEAAKTKKSTVVPHLTLLSFGEIEKEQIKHLTGLIEKEKPNPFILQSSAIVAKKDPLLGYKVSNLMIMIKKTPRLMELHDKLLLKFGKLQSRDMSLIQGANYLPHITISKIPLEKQEKYKKLATSITPFSFIVNSIHLKIQKNGKLIKMQAFDLFPCFKSKE